MARLKRPKPVTLHERREFIDPDLSVGSSVYSVVRREEWSDFDGEGNETGSHERVSGSFSLRDCDRTVDLYFGGKTREQLERASEKALRLEQEIVLFRLKLDQAIKDFEKEKLNGG